MKKSYSALFLFTFLSTTAFAQFNWLDYKPKNNTAQEKDSSSQKHIKSFDHAKDRELIDDEETNFNQKDEKEAKLLTQKSYSWSSRTPSGYIPRSKYWYQDLKALNDPTFKAYYQQVERIIKEYVDLTEEISLTPNEPNLYFRRGVLSLRCWLHMDVLNYCDVGRQEGFDEYAKKLIKVHSLRKPELFEIKELKEILNHPLCKTFDSGSYLASVIERNIGKVRDYVTKEGNSDFLLDPSFNLEKVIEINPNDKDAYFLLADVYEHMEGAVDKQPALLKTIIQKYPEDAISYLQLSEHAWKENEAFKLCQQAISYDENLAEGYVCMAKNVSIDHVCPENLKKCGEDNTWPNSELNYNESSQKVFFYKYTVGLLSKARDLNNEFDNIDELISNEKGYLTYWLRDLEAISCEKEKLINEKHCEKNYPKEKDSIQCFKDAKKKAESCLDSINKDDVNGSSEKLVPNDKESVSNGEIETTIDEDIKSINDLNEYVSTVKNEKRAFKEVEFNSVVETAFKAAKKNAISKEELLEDIFRKQGIDVEQESAVFSTTVANKDIKNNNPSLLNDINDKVSDILSKFDILKDKDTKDNKNETNDQVEQQKQADVEKRDPRVNDLKIKIVDVLYETGRIGIEMIPVVGNVISLYEGLSGKDAFSGEQLSASQRTLSFVFAFVGGGKAWKSIAQGIEKLVGERILKQSTNIAKDIEISAQRATKEVEEQINQKIIFRKGDDVNVELKQKASNPKKYQDSYPMVGTVIEYNLAKDSQFVRVHVKGRGEGVWVMKKEDIVGLTSTQVKDKYALRDLPTHITDVNIPKGIKMRVGFAGENKFGDGGGLQYEILGGTKKDWYLNVRPLEGAVYD